MDKKYLIAKWNNFSHPDGTNYNLDHLTSHEVYYSFDQENPNNHNRSYKVYVSFGLHCFAKDYAYQTAEEAENLNYHINYDSHTSESRPFCVERYNYSLKLPYIIRQLGSKDNKDTAFSFYKEKGYAAFYDTDKNGEKISYKIGINLFKHGKQLHLHVISAYPLAGREKVKTTSFESALKKVRLGKGRNKRPTS